MGATRFCRSWLAVLGLFILGVVVLGGGPGEALASKTVQSAPAQPNPAPTNAPQQVDAFGNPLPSVAPEGQPQASPQPGQPQASSPQPAAPQGSEAPAAGSPFGGDSAPGAAPGGVDSAGPAGPTQPGTPGGPSVWDGPGDAGAAAAGEVAKPGSTRRTEIYGERIEGLRRSVDELKDKIFRSKARLALLEETVLHGVLSGSRVVVTHRNSMSSLFRLTRIEYALDGAAIFARGDDALNEIDEITVFDGNLVPGPHTLTVRLVYRGRGFGVFSYLNGYTFETKETHTFTAEENGSIRVVSTGYERGNFTTEMRDRPAVDWQRVQIDATGKAREVRGQSRRVRSNTRSSGASGAKSRPAKRPAKRVSTSSSKR